MVLLTNALILSGAKRSHRGRVNIVYVTVAKSDFLLEIQYGEELEREGI